MTIIGLFLIVIGWVAQLFGVSKNDKSLNQFFVVFYILGAVLLVLDGLLSAYSAAGVAGLTNGLSLTVVLNMVAAFLAIVTMLKIRQ